MCGSHLYKNSETWRKSMIAHKNVWQNVLKIFGVRRRLVKALRTSTENLACIRTNGGMTGVRGALCAMDGGAVSP